ncbi:MAG TPA: hypothetical protein ENI87_00650 [bacterium]|nr:hypothetical protein [bacterium]
MLKKSLQILVACAFLALGSIVLYALLGMRSPQDSLGDAEALLQRGDNLGAVTLLSRTENSPRIQGSPALLDRLWQLRLEAHTRLGNPKGALRDVRNLLRHGHDDDVELRLAEVRLLAQAGDGEAARLAARAFLADHPDHSRGLELAGEACQSAYQPLLRALGSQLDAELGHAPRERARRAMLAYLFRPVGDPEIERAAADLEALFAGEARLRGAWPRIWRDARQVRERVQEALGYFQRSLDLGGEPVAAFRAVATALQQAGRIDDLLFACEIQRRRFDHAYVDESGARAAWARLLAGLPEAAIATVDRWLPIEQVPERGENDRISDATAQLAAARALAGWLLRDAQSLNATAKLDQAMYAAGRRSLDALNITQAGRRLLRETEDRRPILHHLENLVTRNARLPKPLDRPDLVATFAPLWIDELEAANAAEDEVQTALATWRDARPEDLTPHLRRAEYLLASGNTAAAFSALDTARELAPLDPRLFGLQLRIARRHYQGSANDGAGLLAQCLKNGRKVPETLDTIGFLLCAETALAQTDRRIAVIASNCARAAVNAFPRAVEPRELELQALLRLGRYEEAARAADLAIDALAPSPDLLALAMRARELAGRPLRDLLYRAMPRVARNRELQAALLRIALADAPATAIRFLDPALLAGDQELDRRVLAVRALTAAGRLARAEQVMAAMHFDAKATATSPTMFAEWLLAAAAERDDGELLATLRRLRIPLRLDVGPQSPLLAAAGELADHHPHTARYLLRHALAAATADERNGSLFVLAGELALRDRDTVAAIDAWTAALAFDDGMPAAERLARLLLLAGDAERAEQVYALVPTPDDPALAARFGRLAQAAALLQQALQREPADLITHATLMTFGQPAMLDWSPPADEDLQRERLELLAGLRDPLLGPLCLGRADALLRADPSRRTHYFLLARASADAGLASAAAALHAELFRGGYLGPVLWREVAYAAQDPAYAPAPELLLKLMAATTAGAVGSSPLAMAYGSRMIVEGFLAADQPEMARNTRLLQWRAFPQLHTWTDDDLELIATGYPPTVACQVLDEILRGPHAGDRRTLLERWYALAPAAVAAAPDSLSTLVRTALAHLQSDGALGCIVHFLRTHPVANVPFELAPALIDHLELIARGRDDTSRLDQTLTALLQATGAERTLAALDGLLQRYPSAIPLWGARTRIRQLDAPAEALAELRTVLAHASAPSAELAFLALAAGRRALDPSDYDRLDRLPPELLQSPKGRFVQAVMALRRGDAEQAIEHFAEAAPQPDGSHLFLCALAWLEAPADEGPERATLLLQELLRDYPGSSRAQNAKSFVRQLSPPADGSGDGGTKR